MNRPSAEQVQSQLLKQTVPSERTAPKTLVERIILRLERYAQDLEDQVERRKNDLLNERATCDALLAELLPKSVDANKFPSPERFLLFLSLRSFYLRRAVVTALRNGTLAAAESYDLVTLMFSDIPGFAEFVEVNLTTIVTQCLADLDMSFQKILINFDVQKMDAISDSYLVRH